MSKSLLYDNRYGWMGLEVTKESFWWMANSDTYIQYLRKKSKELNKAVDEWFLLEYQYMKNEMKKHMRRCHFCDKILDVKVEGHWCCNKKTCRSKSMDFLIRKYAPLLDQLAHDD